MKFNTLIHRYIFGEMLPPFFLNLLFFTFIFLLTQLLDITNMIVNYKVGFAVIWRMILYSMPYFFVYIIPMAVMTAILLTFLRLSTDNEIVALKSSGVSIFALLPSVLLFALLGCILCGVMTIYGLPWGKSSLKQQTVNIAAANFNLSLKERTFNDIMGVMLYVNQVNHKNNELIDIFLEDRKSSKFSVSIIAPKGYLYVDKENPAFHLKLLDGASYRVDLKTRAVEMSRFDSYQVNINMQSAVAAITARKKSEKELSLRELLTYIEENRLLKNKDYYEGLIELHRKFSIPVACIVLGILAVPLGIQSRSSRRSFGIFLGLIFFLIYYLLFAMGKVFGETGAYPPIIGMWVPNITMGVIGIYLFYRVMHDRPLKINFLLRFFMHLKSLPIYKAK